MFHLMERCPVCGENCGFHFSHVGEYRIEPPRELSDPAAERFPYRPRIPLIPVKVFASGFCVSCLHPVMAELGVSREELNALKECVTDERERIYDGPPPKIRRLLPEPKAIYSHPSLPEEVRDLFTDLQDMVRQKKSPSLIVAGCRSVLEGAIRRLEGEGDGLRERIRYCRKNGIISKVIGDWAEEINLEGNKAIHELAATSEDAEEMVEFTKIFLQYVFELPARIKEKKRERKKEAATSGQS